MRRISSLAKRQKTKRPCIGLSPGGDCVRTHRDRKSFSHSKEPRPDRVWAHFEHCTRLLGCVLPDPAQHQGGSLERTQLGHFSGESNSGPLFRKGPFRIRSRGRDAVRY